MHMGLVTVLKNGVRMEINAPTLEQLRGYIPIDESLVHLGNGLLLPKRGNFMKELRYEKEIEKCNNDNGATEPDRISQRLILTPTTSRNLARLGTALCSDPYPPPILICGPGGSGKSSLVRELARYCSSLGQFNFSGDSVNEQLLEIHVDEETDSKTLLGSYVATDIPGEFAWRPGSLTTAVRKGKWVLLEDVESCPAEIQASIVKLLEERVLPLGVGKNESCHPNFRIFGTCTTSISSTFNSTTENDCDSIELRNLRKCVYTAGSGGKRLLHPDLWRKVHVDPLPYAELKQVSNELFRTLPNSILDRAINIFRQLDQSDRAEEALDSSKEGKTNLKKNDVDMDIILENKHVSSDENPTIASFTYSGRHVSVRDLMKLLSRISSTIRFEPTISFTTESQRTFCLAETVDIFAAASMKPNQRRDFVKIIAAPAWSLSIDTALNYIENRRPSIKNTEDYVEIGRSRVFRPSVKASEWNALNKQYIDFVETNYSLRLMETLGVCISQNEPMLLVGGRSIEIFFS